MAKKDSKDKALDIALANLKQNFGSGVARRGDSLDVVDTIRTGHDVLDSVLVKDGCGVARGKIIELYGPEGNGKSSVALRICGYAQKDGLIPYWIDLERALVKGGIAEINGVDMESIFIPDLSDTETTDLKEDDASYTPYDAGKVLDLMLKVIETGQFNPVVLDSVAALVPEREMNAESFNDEKMMELPRVMSRALRKINAKAAEKNICVIFVNQERDKPDPSGRPAVTSPGGRALRFYASQRLRISKVGGKEGQITKEVDGKKDIFGHWARVKIVKNRCAPPYFDDIEIPIYYKEYFPDEAERLFDSARELQVITTRNNRFTWKSGDEVVLNEDGIPATLNSIRANGLQARLAFECLKAQKEEKNTKKKTPYYLPQALAKLAVDFENQQTVVS